MKKSKLKKFFDILEFIGIYIGAMCSSFWISSLITHNHTIYILEIVFGGLFALLLLPNLLYYFINWLLKPINKEESK